MQPLEPEERLLENMKLLKDFIENPERFGAFILLRKIKHAESKMPYNVELSDLHRKMRRRIKRMNKVLNYYPGNYLY